MTRAIIGHESVARAGPTGTMSFVTLEEFLLARVREVEGAGTARRRSLACQAAQRIVGLHWATKETSPRGAAGDCFTCGVPAPCQTLRLLALPFADHTDYRAHWRP